MPEFKQLWLYVSLLKSDVNIIVGDVYENSKKEIFLFEFNILVVMVYMRIKIT